jgi:VWFA-related protein
VSGFSRTCAILRHPTVRHWAAASAVLVLAAVPTALAQQPAAPQPTFRTEINYVELPVRVLDRKGTFVRDLQQSDFQVLEDGKPQAITSFSVVDIPIVPPTTPGTTPPASAPEAVATNDAAHLDGRVYVFVLDDEHVRADKTFKVREIAERFIRQQMNATDVAAVTFVSGAASQNFTQNRDLLIKAVERYVSFEGLPTGGPYATLKTLANLSDWMADIRGRRKIRCDIASTGATGAFEDSCPNALADAIEAAVRAGVSIYTMDPQALTEDSGALDVSGAPGAAQRSGRPMDNQVAFASIMRLETNTLREMANNTGGFATINTDSFGDSFDRIIRENSSYYLIGYYSSNDKTDGKFRKNEIKVSRSGTQVLFRTGYTAPRAARTRVAAGAQPLEADVTAQLSSLMRSPLPVTGMTLRVVAAPFLGVDGKTSLAVIVEAPGDVLKFTEANGTYNDNIGMSIGLYDRSGKSKAGEQPNIRLNLQADSYTRATAEGVRLIARLAVVPGSYRLWVGATQAPSGVHGSAMTEVEVPDFKAQPLSVRGLAVTTAAADRMMTARNDELLDQALGAPPSAQREFSADSEVWIFTEIYDNRSNGGEVTAGVTVKTQDGKTVYQVPLEAAPIQFGYLARIPLKELGAGSYVVTVDVRSESPANVSATRSMQFLVR